MQTLITLWNIVYQIFFFFVNSMMILFQLWVKKWLYTFTYERSIVRQKSIGWSVGRVGNYRAHRNLDRLEHGVCPCRIAHINCIFALCRKLEAIEMKRAPSRYIGVTFFSYHGFAQVFLNTVFTLHCNTVIRYGFTDIRTTCLDTTGRLCAILRSTLLFL